MNGKRWIALLLALACVLLAGCQSRAAQEDESVPGAAEEKTGDVAVAQVLDPHCGQGIVQAPLDLILRNREILKAVQDLVLDHRCHDLGIDILANATDQTTYIAQRRLARVDAVDLHASIKIARIAIRDDAVKRIRESGLSRPGSTGDAHERPIGNNEVDVLQQKILALAIAERQLRYFNHDRTFQGKRRSGEERLVEDDQPKGSAQSHA